MSQSRANKSSQGGLFGRILWRGAWILQGLAWGFLLLFVLHYWIIEVPAVRGYHEAGLADGFDGLAGIVASIDPQLGDLDNIKGRPGGNRFTRLQGDVIFTVWREQDELPTWNAGLARLCFDQSGRLLWARRYPAADKKTDLVEDKSKQINLPVVYSWSQRLTRGNEQGVSGGTAPAQSAPSAAAGGRDSIATPGAAHTAEPAAGAAEAAQPAGSGGRP